MTKRFGGVTALNRLTLELEKGSVTSVIGSNGAGKTTLLNVISQMTPADEGRVLLGTTELTGRPPQEIVRLGVARTFQQLRIFHKLSVLDNVLLGFQRNSGESLSRVFATPWCITATSRRNREQAHVILDAVGLLDHANAPAGTLSYGQQKLVSLARVIATGADLLMLDEPTAGLPSDFIELILTLVRRLVAEGKTTLLIEHDMDVVFGVSDRVIVLDEGRLFFEGPPDVVRKNPEVRALYFGTRVG